MPIAAPRTRPGRYTGRVMVWTDFGGVLTPPLSESLNRVAAAAGVSPAVLSAAVHGVTDERGGPLLHQLELGRITERAWGERVAAELARAGTPSRIDLGEFGRHWYAGRALNQPLLAGLLGLRAHGVPVGLLTNSVREWQPHRAALLPAPDLFHPVVQSHEVGLRKPDPAVYRWAERAAGVAPGECLLIDDLAGNCAAARARGWRVIEHRDTAATLRALAGLLT